MYSVSPWVWLRTFHDVFQTEIVVAWLVIIHCCVAHYNTINGCIIDELYINDRKKFFYTHLPYIEAHDLISTWETVLFVSMFEDKFIA